MINVNFIPPKEIIVSGHSGTMGTSVICATVSTCMNLLGYGLDKSGFRMEEEMKPGYHRILLKDEPNILFDTVISYLKDFSEELPEEVQFSIK